MTHLLRSSPCRLLLVTTGNVTNDDLVERFDRNLDAVVAALEEVRFVELGHEKLVVHDDRERSASTPVFVPTMRLEANPAPSSAREALIGR